VLERSAIVLKWSAIVLKRSAIVLKRSAAREALAADGILKNGRCVALRSGLRQSGRRWRANFIVEAKASTYLMQWRRPAGAG
jgi:hypothetical protein